MSNSHYWDDTIGINKFDSETLKTIKAIAYDYDLCYDNDKPFEKPEILENRIRFNSKNEKGFDTFYFNFTSRFCKTYSRFYKEYDLPVCLVLMAIKYYLRDNIHITTSGDMNSWNKAFKEISWYIPDALFQIKNNELFVNIRSEIISNKEEIPFLY